ncbi:response regulator [Oscillatoria sp. FACHB-1407]|uniref:response regulator n=1 Tax=Oscillatoria sp. FACHB-1407 TaxID=2692847 RepID=UPI001682280D|nr:response regulator [Oscillatoria sp. FACHB-1407]MBD2460498.1 response regulator [Oscillatoria sp. FACHB-1407]
MSQSTDHTSKKLKLQALFTTILVVPFVLQLLVTVGLVGWLSLRSGERAVNQVSDQLRDETANRIQDQLKNYLEVPHRLNQANVDAALMGEIDFNNINRLESRFWQQIRLYDSISNIGFGSVRGSYVASDRRDNLIRIGHKDENSPQGALHMYEADEMGRPTLRLAYRGRPNYDPRRRPWYRLGQTSPQGQWTEIFTYSAQPIYVISAVRAVYDQADTFQGVLITDLLLSDIGKFLQSLEIGRTGEAFILERSGQLVAASTPEIPYQVVEGKAQRLQATNSDSPLIRATAVYLSQQFASLDQVQTVQQLDFTVDNTRQFVQVVPYSDPRGLDWLIVVVIPETDFMEGIYATAHSTAWLFLIALAIATGVGLFTARWLVRPIARLSAAATVLAEGNWDRTLPIEREDELGVLAEAFNRMAGRLKESLATIRQREARLAEAQQVAHVGSWEFDRATETVSWSDELFRIEGLEIQSMKPQYPVILGQVHPEDAEIVQRALDRALHQAQPFEIDYRILQPSGQVREVHARGQVARNETGQVTRIFGTVLDITDRKQIERDRDRLLELEQAARADAEAANQAKDRFLAVLSHELRTPLNPILGWTQLLQTGRLDQPQTSKALETIERNVKLQTQLIDDLLDVSRILRGKLSLKAEPVDLVAAIAAAIETTRLAAEAKSIRVSTDFTPIPMQVNGDLARLQQIIWNLLSNAIKFTPEGGQVEVILEQLATPTNGKVEHPAGGASNGHSRSSALAVPPYPFSIHPPLWQSITQHTPSLPRSYAQITVRDNGQGIASDFLPHLFDDFWQADNSSTRVAGGLGLGLAIARHLVQLHDGIIMATSAGLGKGSSFTVLLPLIELASPLDSYEPSDLDRFGSTAPLRGLHLLLVDDEPDNLEFLTLLLQDQGATITTTTTAATALEYLTTHPTDVLISDINMPDVDGYDLIRRVRSQVAVLNPQVPAIALTAHAGEAHQQQSLAAGFQVHLAKPVEPTELVMTILNLVRSRE